MNEQTRSRDQVERRTPPSLRGSSVKVSLGGGGDRTYAATACRTAHGRFEKMEQFWTGKSLRRAPRDEFGELDRDFGHTQSEVISSRERATRADRRRTMRKRRLVPAIDQRRDDRMTGIPLGGTTAPNIVSSDCALSKIRSGFGASPNKL